MVASFLRRKYAQYSIWHEEWYARRQERKAEKEARELDRRIYPNRCPSCKHPNSFFGYAGMDGTGGVLEGASCDECNYTV